MVSNTPPLAAAVDWAELLADESDAAAFDPEHVEAFAVYSAPDRLPDAHQVLRAKLVSGRKQAVWAYAVRRGRRALARLLVMPSHRRRLQQQARLAELVARLPWRLQQRAPMSLLVADNQLTHEVWLSFSNPRYTVVG
jgi:hypothetical protein